VYRFERWSGSQSTGVPHQKRLVPRHRHLHYFLHRPWRKRECLCGSDGRQYSYRSITVTSENTKYPSIACRVVGLTGNVSGGIVCSASGNVLWQGIHARNSADVPGLPATVTHILSPNGKTTVSGYPSIPSNRFRLRKKRMTHYGLVQLSLDNAFSTIAMPPQSHSWAYTNTDIQHPPPHSQFFGCRTRLCR